MAERRERGQGRVKERCEAKKEGAAWDSWRAASGELLVGGARRADSVVAMLGDLSCGDDNILFVVSCPFVSDLMLNVVLIDVRLLGLGSWSINQWVELWLTNPHQFGDGGASAAHARGSSACVSTTSRNKVTSYNNTHILSTIEYEHPALHCGAYALIPDWKIIMRPYFHQNACLDDLLDHIPTFGS